MDTASPSTLLHFAGVEVPDDMQGHSLRPLLEGESDEPWRESIYSKDVGGAGDVVVEIRHSIPLGIDDRAALDDGDGTAWTVRTVPSGEHRIHAGFA